MKVLLTGATGLVGSHILDVLRHRKLAVRLLVRRRSDLSFVAAHLRHVEVHHGSLTDPAGLDRALAGVTRVIHCAGATKALRPDGFFAVNQAATRQVVEAVNRHGGIHRLLHISSLAAAGPSRPGEPRREADPPAPVSTYGRSKLAGEQEVTNGCRADFVVLRPPAVYGPRDMEFLRLFKAVRQRVLPLIAGGRQQLSLVYVRDLAEAAVHCLTHPAASRQTYFVAAEEIVTARQLGEEIASHLSVQPWRLPLPSGLLWLVCLAQDAAARLTRKPRVLGLQKYPELLQPAWTCDATKLTRDTGFVCHTLIYEGVPRALDWYRQNQLL